MWIEQVRLQNIKSYQDCTVTLHRGVNFISGHNGAGKSTLIEAIGVALFDAMGTKFVQLLRWGARSGSIDVWFHTAHGDYRVERKITPRGSGAWQAFDVDSGQRLALHEDADMRAWLAEALGLIGVPSLAEHFAELVAVRQGTFVAPFLLAPAPRKAYFDPLFDIDSFKRAGERAREPERVLEERAAQSELLYVQAQTRAEGLADAQIQQEAVRHEVLLARQTHHEATALYAKIGEAWQQRLALSKRLTELDAALDAQRRVVEETAQRLTQARKACTEHTERLQKERTQSAVWEQETAVAAEALLQRAAEQGRLEQRVKALVDRVTTLERLSVQRTETARELAETEDELSEEPALQQVEAMAIEWEAQIQALREQYSGLDAQKKTLERNIQQSSGGLCPFLGEPCRNIEGDLSRHFEGELADVCKKLLAVGTAGQEKKNALAVAAPQRERLKALGKRRAAYETRQADLRRTDAEIEDVMAALQALESLDAGPADREAYVRLARKLQAEAKTSQERLLQAQRVQQQAESRVAGQRVQVKGAEQALRLAEQQCEAGTQEAERSALRLEELAAQQKRAAQEQRALAADPQGAPPDEHTLQEAGQRMAQAQMRAETGEKELLRFTALLQEKREAQAQADAHGRALEEVRQGLSVMRLLREVLSGAGERIATVLRGQLAMEAERIYRRIAQESVALVWSDGYEVQLVDQQNGLERRRNFGQLSGGERMSAALAIRLALLLQCSPLRFACFDEPTDALDAERRVNLAQVLPELTTQWEQVLLISHDDAFDAITENNLQLEGRREGTRIRA